MKKIFVTATDTDAGKTMVAKALLYALQQQHLQCVPFKPVAAGACWQGGQWRNDDALQLMGVCGLTVDAASYHKTNPFCFAPAIAPHIAAAQAGVEVSVRVLREHVNSAFSEAVDCLLIEGAGGWLVPLNRAETLADFAEQQGAGIVLVIGMKLGCINHALLTQANLRQRGLRLLGWVANQAQPEQMVEYEANIASLTTLLDAPCLGVIPFVSDPNEALIAQYLATELLL